MFFPLPEETGRTRDFRILELLIEAKKERFLSHPIFETYLKLKWYGTWKIYVLILILYASFLLSLIGYAMAHYGHDQRLVPVDKRATGWAGFLTVTTAFLAVYVLAETTRTVQRHAHTGKGLLSVLAVLSTQSGCDLSVVVMSMVLLMAPLDKDEVLKYVCAVVVVTSCHMFMRVLSRLPRIGIYFFMIKMVFVSILKFLLSYIWHFLGYAVAFHILLPKSEAFTNLGDSFIKV
jgi:hypothetical protein